MCFQRVSSPAIARHNLQIDEINPHGKGERVTLPEYFQHALPSGRLGRQEPEHEQHELPWQHEQTTDGYMTTIHLASLSLALYPFSCHRYSSSLLLLLLLLLLFLVFVLPLERIFPIQ